jgi:hypothetical protein
LAPRGAPHEGNSGEIGGPRGCQAAKVALGERGSPPWCEQNDSERQARWQTKVNEPGDGDTD